MMIIENNFNIGDTVYLKTDTDQLEHIITGMFVSIDGVKYLCKKGSNDFYCYDFELSLTRDVIKTTSS